MTDEPAHLLAAYIANFEPGDPHVDRFVAGLTEQFDTHELLVSFVAALANLLEVEPFNAKYVLGDYSPADLIDTGAAVRRWKQYVAATLALETERERGERLMMDNDVVVEVSTRVIADGIARNQGWAGPALTELMAWGYAARAIAKILRNEVDDERFEKLLAGARRIAADSQMDD